jgi:hypothetical protein
MKKILFSFSIVLLLSGICVSQIDSTYNIGKSLTIDSKVLEGEVTYHVHLPYGYEESEETFPVIYLMNGHLMTTFASSVAIIEKLSGKRIPDMIVIGISNTGVARNYWACPNDSGSVEPADKFYSFLETELLPKTQKDYRTNGYKILMGQSNTGLYVTYNLLFYPDLFNDYIVSSPMFGWCSEFYMEQTKSFLQTKETVNKKLYISYGDMDYIEVLDHIDDYKEILEQHAPKDLHWKLEKFENTGHVPLMTLNNALLYFFSEYTMTTERKKFSIPEIESHFEKLSKEYGFTVIPKSGVLLDIAFDLRDENKLDEAIEMFDYLISLYPNSALNYYGKGLVFLRKKETDLAKECFNKSLEIDPEYIRSINILKRLNQ